MDKILIFAGTFEGRKLCEFLMNNGYRPTVCVATDYGKVMLDDIKGADVRTGRLKEEEMIDIMRDYELVIDATHPYATVVSHNVKEACVVTGVKYIRLTREESKFEDVIAVSSTEEAVKLLNNMKGNILLTTGSKELHKYQSVTDFTSRVFARVLPSSEVLSMCENLGLKGRNIIAMQGPFSEDLNVSMLRDYGCVIMVTKSTGDVGGFTEKVNSAKKAGAKVVVIERPNKEDGLSFEEVKAIFEGNFELKESITEHKKDENVDSKNDDINLDYTKNDEDSNSKSNDKESHLKNNDKNLNYKSNDESIDLENKKIRYFPAFVDSYGLKVLVVGCGRIASKRIKKLSNFGFEITVVAPNFDEQIENVCYVKRDFQAEDVIDMDIVLAATDNREVNKIVSDLVKNRGSWCSVADCKEDGNLIFPSILLEDDMVVAISSDGKNAKKTRSFSSKLRLVLRGDEADEN